MKSLTVGDMKTRFSAVLREVQAGTPVAIEFGRKHTRVAVIVPYDRYAQADPRRIGVLEGKASYRTRRDFAMTDKDLLEK